MAQGGFLGLYNPDDVSVVVNGVTLEGFDEEFIEIERVVNENWKEKVGPQGDVTFVKNQNFVAKIKISLKQNAPHNRDVLRPLANADTIFATTISINQPYKQVATATTCIVSATPRKNFKADESPRTWEIMCSRLIENDT